MDLLSFKPNYSLMSSNVSVHSCVKML